MCFCGITAHYLFVIVLFSCYFSYHEPHSENTHLYTSGVVSEIKAANSKAVPSFHLARVTSHSRCEYLLDSNLPWVCSAQNMAEKADERLGDDGGLAAAPGHENGNSEEAESLLANDKEFLWILIMSFLCSSVKC